MSFVFMAQYLNPWSHYFTFYFVFPFYFFSSSGRINTQIHLNVKTNDFLGWSSKAPAPLLLSLGDMYLYVQEM